MALRMTAAVLALGLVACGKKDGTTFPSLDTWQGTTTIDLQSGGKPGVVTVAKRGDVYRFEAPQHGEVFGSYGGGEGARRFLFDAKAKTLTLVVDGPKQALDYDLTVLDGLTNKDKSSDFELTDTGKKDTVAGFSCDVWSGKSGSTSAEACVVKQQAAALAFGAGFLPAGAGWGKTLLDGEHVPLSVVVKEGDTVTWSARLKTFDQKVPDGAFEVPGDYQRANFLDALRKVKAKQGP